MLEPEYIEINDEQQSNLSLIESYSKPVLEYIHRGIPNYTNHGIFHVLNVIENINKLFEAYRQLGFGLNQKELYILYISAWLHDWGNIKIKSAEDRGSHARYSYEIIDELIDYLYFLGEDVIECVKCIVLHHSTSSGSDINAIVDISDVRLKLLSALFRIADACDASFSRASKILFKILKKQFTDENIQFWEAHQAILNIQFSNNEIILEVKNKTKAQLVIDSLEKELKDVNKVLEEYGLPVLSLNIKELPKF